MNAKKQDIEVMNTVKIVTTMKLLELETVSNQLGFNQNLPVEWLEQVIDFDSPHFIFPELIHHSAGSRQVEPHLRSVLRVKVNPYENWMNSLYLVSLIDLPIKMVESLKDVNLMRWFICSYYKLLHCLGV